MKTLNITSLQNEKIKYALKLKENKYIKEFNKTIVESFKLIKDLILNGKKVESVFLTEESLNKHKDFFEKLDILVIITTSEIINKLSNVVTSDEVIAIVYVNFEKDIINLKNFLVLDNVQDPTNLGAIVRSACAFNFKDIILISGTNPYSLKVSRCSMGQNFNVKFYNFELDEFINFAKNNNLALFGLNMNGENLYKITNKPNSFGLVLGSEGKGINEKLYSLFSHTLCIPMQNNVESLNVAVSASIVMSYYNHI